LIEKKPTYCVVWRFGIH